MHPLTSALRWCLVMALCPAGLCACETQPSAEGAVSTGQSSDATALAPTTAARLANGYLNGMADFGAFGGVVVVSRDNQILLRQAYGDTNRLLQQPNTVETRFRLGTLTSLFTSVAILQLQDEGKLTLMDPVCLWVLDCPASWTSLTVQHLLTHTSGIKEFTATGDYERIKDQWTSPETLLGIFKDRDLLFAPGTGWHYSTANNVLLGIAIERASGVPYQAYVEANILTPLGLTHTSFAQNPEQLATGYARWTKYLADPFDVSAAYAWGGLTATADDLLLFAQALETEALIPLETKAQWLAPRARIPGEPDWRQGYGWVVSAETLAGEVFGQGHIDGFSTALDCFPRAHLTIVVLSNQEDVDALGIAHEIARLVFQNPDGDFIDLPPAPYHPGLHHWME